MKINESARLSYRLMDECDGESLFELDQDSAVMKYINDSKPTTRKELETVFLPRMLSYLDPEKGWGIWQVTDKSNNAYIGWILVRPMYFFSEQRDDLDLELGWRFKQETWGKGYATEAASHISQVFADQQTKIKAFTAIAVKENLASIEVMKKLGMTFVKQAIHKDPLGNWDVVYYSKSLTSDDN